MIITTDYKYIFVCSGEHENVFVGDSLSHTCFCSETTPSNYSLSTSRPKTWLRLSFVDFDSGTFPKWPCAVMGATHLENPTVVQWCPVMLEIPLHIAKPQNSGKK